MTVKPQVIHFFNAGVDSRCEVDFSVFDANGKEQGHGRIQYQPGASAVASLLADAQARVDAAVADVSVAARPTSLVATLRELDAARAEIAAKDKVLADADAAIAAKEAQLASLEKRP